MYDMMMEDIAREYTFARKIPISATAKVLAGITLPDTNIAVGMPGECGNPSKSRMRPSAFTSPEIS